MRHSFILLLFLLGGCVPDEVHEERIAADQARITELTAQTAELQGAVAGTLATTRLLEVACVTNGLLLAVCLGALWLRSRKKGGPS